MRGRFSQLLLCGLVPLACYVNTPVDTAVRPLAPGDQVALDVSDQGRVGLGERFGPGVTQIEGRIRSVTADALRLQVYRVAYLREGSSQWAGEDVTIDRQHVGRVYHKTLSRGRTVAAAAAVGGTIVAFVVTRALVSAGRERDPGTDPPDPPISTRFPRLSVTY